MDKVEGTLANTKKEIKTLEPYIESQLKELQNALDEQSKVEKLEANLTLATKALHCALENKKVPKLGMVHPEFKRVGSRYFYVEHNVQLDWFDASAKCREMGGHLALPQSEEELRLIYGILEPRWFWIDLSDLVEVGKWRSLVTGGDPPFKVVWNAGYPKRDSSDERCVFTFILNVSNHYPVVSDHELVVTSPPR
nr:C-type lectin 37Db [Drosophila takahashii]